MHGRWKTATEANKRPTPCSRLIIRHDAPKIRTRPGSKTLLVGQNQGKRSSRVHGSISPSARLVAATTASLSVALPLPTTPHTFNRKIYGARTNRIDAEVQRFYKLQCKNKVSQNQAIQYAIPRFTKSMSRKQSFRKRRCCVVVLVAACVTVPHAPRPHS